MLLYLSFSLLSLSAFACNDEFLQCSSGDLFAFRDLPCDQMFVPAVSVYMGEQVHMILSSVEVRERCNVYTTHSHACSELYVFAL